MVTSSSISFKSIIITVIVLITCLIIVMNRDKVINFYLSFKYPSPIVFDGIELPISKGTVYVISEEGVRITDAFKKKFSIELTKNFSPYKDSVELYLERLDHILSKVESYEHNDIIITKALSVDRLWRFNIIYYIPSQKILIKYQGDKNHYESVEKIIDLVLADIH